MQADRLAMPSAHDARRRALMHALFAILRDFARCEDPTNYENIEEVGNRILDLSTLYDADLEVRAKIAEAAINKYVLTSTMLQPGPFKAPLFHPQYAEAVEAVARAIYNVELARGDHASSVLINMMVGKPGSKATPEGIRETCRIEPYEENPESWREYAVSAIAAFLAHKPAPPPAAPIEGGTK